MTSQRANTLFKRASGAIPALSGLALAMSLATYANAAEPHVHGLAQLQIGIEDNHVDLIFTSPAANLVGFEHALQTDPQHKAVQNARDFFRSQPLVVSGSAGCTLAEVTLSGSLFEAEAHDGNHPDSEHAHHGDHAEHHRDHESHEREHSDLMVSQRLSCEDDWREGLRTTLLERFGGIESLQVQWVSESSQGSTTLTGGDSALQLQD